MFESPKAVVNELSVSALHNPARRGTIGYAPCGGTIGSWSTLQGLRASQAGGTGKTMWALAYFARFATTPGEIAQLRDQMLFLSCTGTDLPDVGKLQHGSLKGIVYAVHAHTRRGGQTHEDAFAL